MSALSDSQVIVRDDDKVRQLAEDLLNLSDDAIVAWDTETTGLSPWAGDYITGISFLIVERDPETYEWPFQQREGVYVPIGHKRGNASPSSVKYLLDALRRTDAVHMLHHATFDWTVVDNYGVDVRSSSTIDTQVVRWLQDENQPKALKVLGDLFFDEDQSREQRELKAKMVSPWENQTQAYKAVRAAYPEIPVKEARAMARRMRADRGWGDLTPDEMAPYAAHDPELTAWVGEYMIGYDAVLEPEKPLAREMELQPILFDMTHRGVSADYGKLGAARTLYAAAAEKIRDDIDHAYGSYSPWWGNGEAFNPNSTDQCTWLLYDHLNLPIVSRTDSGAPSTDKNALEMLQGHPMAAAIIEYRHLVKGAGAYASSFMEYMEKSPDGRIHGMYDSTRTVTGRLSASNPNVMTIPKVGSLPEIRSAFHHTPPGITRYGFDLASAELWVTAHFTKDPVLEAALLEGRNLHVETMKAIFGVEDKESRFYTLSKNVNYGAAYEAGPGQMTIYAAKAGYSLEEAKRIGYKAWRGHRNLYKRQHFVADRFAALAKERGKLPLHVPGRYRHFNTPGVWVQYYTALNALVQGGVAEFMKDVMLEVYRRGYGELLVLQVHDELVFDAPTGMDTELLQLLTQIAQDINPFRHVLTWDAHAWADAA